jgi:hypothetical protein
MADQFYYMDIDTINLLIEYIPVYCLAYCTQVPYLSEKAQARYRSKGYNLPSLVADAVSRNDIGYCITTYDRMINDHMRNVSYTKPHGNCFHPWYIAIKHGRIDILNIFETIDTKFKLLDTGVTFNCGNTQDNVYNIALNIPTFRWLVEYYDRQGLMTAQYISYLTARALEFDDIPLIGWLLSNRPNLELTKTKRPHTLTITGNDYLGIALESCPAYREKLVNIIRRKPKLLEWFRMNCHVAAIAIMEHELRDAN